MEFKPAEQQKEDEALERDLASDRAKNNGIWERIAAEAQLNAQVNQPRGNWS